MIRKEKNLKLKMMKMKMKNKFNKIGLNNIIKI